MQQEQKQQRRNDQTASRQRQRLVKNLVPNLGSRGMDVLVWTRSGTIQRTATAATIQQVQQCIAHDQALVTAGFSAPLQAFRHLNKAAAASQNTTAASHPPSAQTQHQSSQSSQPPSAAACPVKGSNSQAMTAQAGHADQLPSNVLLASQADLMLQATQQEAGQTSHTERLPGPALPASQPMSCKLHNSSHRQILW